MGIPIKEMGHGVYSINSCKEKTIFSASVFDFLWMDSV